MAKLIDDPNVQALVSKQVAVATKSSTRSFIGHLRDVLGELKDTASATEKKLLKQFHDTVKARSTATGE